MTLRQELSPSSHLLTIMVQYSGKTLILVLFASVLCPAPGWTASIGNDNGFMDSLSTGFRFASKLLGMNQSASVANLVAQAFSGSPTNNAVPKITNKQSQNALYEDSEYSSDDRDNFVVSTVKPEPHSPEFQFEERPTFGTTASPTTTSAPSGTALPGIASLLRVLGMDEKKLSALMVNGLIFIAQMVKNGAEYLKRFIPVKESLRQLILKFSSSSNPFKFTKRSEILSLGTLNTH